jgi:hypothetical protein
LTTSTSAFEELQGRLADAWTLNRSGCDANHVVVALPSFSVGESLLSHYAERIAALEHRYLIAQLLLHRIPGCEMVFLSSVPPGREVMDYYASLVPAAHRASMQRRCWSLAVPDRSARSVAAKLLDRPDLIASIRAWIGDRPAFIEPWNVTDAEVDVALRLGVPINGTAPALWPLGFKSAGRRMFADAAVPAPYGREDIRTVDDVVAAIADIREARPIAPAAVIKHDNSGAGDGNVVLDLSGVPPGAAGEAEIRRLVDALPPWYLDDLSAGGIVEERIAGEQFSSPSVQVDIAPDGEVTVVATHEQVLGGEDEQVYTGCRFPADSAYAGELASHGLSIGIQLAHLGARGRFSADFVAARDASSPWQLYGLEVNLRKGGTTHPYTALRNLVPGTYDSPSGQWQSSDGSPRSYCATDNLVDPAWVGLPPARVIAAVAHAGLEFDYGTGTGVVLHMLSCLDIDGRCGLVAIGRSAEHAQALYDATRTAIDGVAAPSV